MSIFGHTYVQENKTGEGQTLKCIICEILKLASGKQMAQSAVNDAVTGLKRRHS